MFTPKIQGYVVGFRGRVEPSRVLQQMFDTVEVIMDDGVYQRRKVVVVDQVDGLRLNCNSLGSATSPRGERGLTSEQGIQHV